MPGPQNAPSACVIIIGNEILSGRTRDANLAFLGRRCDELGIRLVEARVVRDVEEDIVAHVNACRALYDYVFTTGGIGPTHDDITCAAIARAFGVKVIRHPAALEALHRYYEPGRLNEARLRMADVPEGATLIDNPVSGAPGFQAGNVFVLPGVPEIMQAIFDGMTDRLVGGPPMLTRVVTTDIPEGNLAAALGDIQARYPDLAIGSYPYFRTGSLGVNLVLRGTDAGRLDAATHDVRAMVTGHGGKLFNP